jgi:hypothetical protein
MPLDSVASFLCGLFLIAPTAAQSPLQDTPAQAAIAPVEIQVPELEYPNWLFAALLNGGQNLAGADEDEKIRENQSFAWPAIEAAKGLGLSAVTDPGLKEDPARGRALKATPISQAKKKAVANESETPAIAPFSEVVIAVKPTVLSELSAETIKRKERIESCLKNHYTKLVNADLLRPWSIMHGVLAYGQNSLVVSQGKRISAVDYLCQNGVGNDRRLLVLNQDKLAVAVGAGFQGHEGQLLAILGQVQTPIDHPISINGQAFTVRDLVEYEKATCRPGTELTFKLIGLSIYLSSEETWKDNSGQRWDLSRLMYEEMAQPINGAACGGTHRLMGLSYALAMRRARGEEIDGQWKRAENFLAGYHKQVFSSLQNSDGGFSTEFFEGLSNSADPIRQIYSTGHCLEWLSISMSDEQLVSPDVTKMVDKLLSLMETEYRPEQELNGTDVGPKGHALRALRLYELRLFGQSSNHLALAALDPRPVIGAQEIPAIQKNQRVIQAKSTEAAGWISSGSSATQSKPSPSMPNMRGNRMMRRR